MNIHAQSFEANLVNAKKKTTALLALFIATCAIAFAGILIRLSENEIGPIATIFNRCWIATIVFGIWSQFSSGENNAPEQELAPKSFSHWVLLLAAGMLFTGSQISWAWSLAHTTVALSTLLHNLIPLFTCLGGWILLGQRYEQQFIFGLLVAIGGCVLIGWDDVQTSAPSGLGDASAVISAMFHAAYILVVKQLRATVKTTTVLFWACAFGSLVSLLIVMLTEDQIFPNSFSGWLIVIALALVCQVLGQGLIAYALNQLSGGLISLCLLSESILAAILAWLIFAEQLNWTTATAFIFIMLGLYLSVSSSSALD